jgi:hypothetical protein
VDIATHEIVVLKFRGRIILNFFYIKYINEFK